MNKPFYFIGDPLVSDIIAPIQILPNLYLKKPNSLQIKIIKNELNIPINPYEIWIDIDESKHTRTYNEIKKRNLWKYWILEIDMIRNEFEKENNKIFKSK
jgi:hypothetical protein